MIQLERRLFKQSLPWTSFTWFLGCFLAVSFSVSQPAEAFINTAQLQSVPSQSDKNNLIPLKEIRLLNSQNGTLDIRLKSHRFAPSSILEQSDRKTIIELEHISPASTIRTDFRDAHNIDSVMIQSMGDHRIRLVIRGTQLGRPVVGFEAEERPVPTTTSSVTSQLKSLQSLTEDTAETDIESAEPKNDTDTSAFAIEDNATIGESAMDGLELEEDPNTERETTQNIPVQTLRPGMDAEKPQVRDLPKAPPVSTDWPTNFTDNLLQIGIMFTLLGGVAYFLYRRMQKNPQSFAYQPPPEMLYAEARRRDNIGISGFRNAIQADENRLDGRFQTSPIRTNSAQNALPSQYDVDPRYDGRLNPRGNMEAQADYPDLYDYQAMKRFPDLRGASMGNSIGNTIGNGIANGINAGINAAMASISRPAVPTGNMGKTSLPKQPSNKPEVQSLLRNPQAAPTRPNTRKENTIAKPVAPPVKQAAQQYAKQDRPTPKNAGMLQNEPINQARPQNRAGKQPKTPSVDVQNSNQVAALQQLAALKAKMTPGASIPSSNSERPLIDRSLLQQSGQANLKQRPIQSIIPPPDSPLPDNPQVLEFLRSVADHMERDGNSAAARRIQQFTR